MSVPKLSDDKDFVAARASHSLSWVLRSLVEGDRVSTLDPTTMLQEGRRASASIEREMEVD